MQSNFFFFNADECIYGDFSSLNIRKSVRNNTPELFPLKSPDLKQSIKTLGLNAPL